MERITHSLPRERVYTYRIEQIIQMDKKWATNTNTEKKKNNQFHLTQVKVHPRLFIATFGIALRYRNETGQIQICEDIFISHVEQGQMDIKNVSWLERAHFPLGKHLGCCIVLENRRQEFQAFSPCLG